MSSIDFKEAIQQFGTPTYIFDIDILPQRVKAIKSIADQKVALCYAIKANPFLTKEMSDLTDRIEVCSPGELEICIAENIDPSKILISGVNKTSDLIERALYYGVRFFTAESVKHMNLLHAVAFEKKTSIKVFLRLTSGSQFGMDKSALITIISERAEYKYCEILGIHYFVGTQRGKLSQHAKELGKIKQLMLSLKEEYGYETKELEYGPGLYYPYFQNEEESGLGLFHEFMDVFNTVGIECRTTIEMGRYFAAECGYYLTAVNDTKVNKKHRIAIVDGGVHHLNYYGGGMGMFIPKFVILKAEKLPREKNEWMICGSLCSTADVIISSVEIEDLKEDDVFVFKNVGAYSMTEGLSLFLSRDLPKVIIYKNGSFEEKRGRISTFQFNH